MTHALLTDPIFKNKASGKGFYIPYFVLLGVLYCAGNNRIRATKFFELCQIDLDPHMSHNDKEFVDYFPKLLQISYEMMLRMYDKFREEGSPELKKEWKQDPERIAIEYETIFSKMVDDLFGDTSKLDN